MNTGFYTPASELPVLSSTSKGAGETDSAGLVHNAPEEPLHTGPGAAEQTL